MSFQTRPGNPFRDIKRSFQRALKAAGVKQSEDRRQKIVFHILSDTCISILREMGIDTTMVKNYVSHTSEEMTKQYTHLSKKYARKTAERLNGLCGVSVGLGNRMESIEKNLTYLRTPLAHLPEIANKMVGERRFELDMGEIEKSKWF